MRNTIIYTLAAVFIATFSAGCSSSENTAVTRLPSAKSSESAVISTITPQRSPPEGTIDYSRTGGFVGIDERWRLFTDGRVVDAQSVEYEVSEIEIAGLFDEIEALGFYEWEAGPERPGSCADCFTYTISSSYDRQSNQMTFVDAQADVPEGIWIILDRIQNILGSITENQED